MERNLADYDYLVQMSLIRLSEEEVLSLLWSILRLTNKDLQFQRLLKQAEAKRKELESLKNRSETDLWNEDLDVFMAALEKQEEKERKDLQLGLATVNLRFRIFGLRLLFAICIKR